MLREHLRASPSRRYRSYSIVSPFLPQTRTTPLQINSKYIYSPIVPSLPFVRTLISASVIYASVIYATAIVAVTQNVTTPLSYPTEVFLPLKGYSEAAPRYSTFENELATDQAMGLRERKGSRGRFGRWRGTRSLRER